MKTLTRTLAILLLLLTWGSASAQEPELLPLPHEVTEEEVAPVGAKDPGFLAGGILVGVLLLTAIYRATRSRRGSEE